MVNRLEEEVTPYISSPFHKEVVTAQAALEDLLSDPNKLAEAGPAGLLDVMARLGVEPSTDTTVEAWETEAMSTFERMYKQLLRGCDRGTRPHRDARSAQSDFTSCLTQRRGFWQKIRSDIFTDQKPKVHEAQIFASPMIRE